MGVTWQQLQDTPAYVVDDYRLVMEAEYNDAKRKARDAKG